MPEGQELLSGLLDSAFEMAQDIKGREAEDDVTPSIKPIYDRLYEMKNQLDQLCMFLSLYYYDHKHKLTVNSCDTSLDTTRDGLVQVSHLCCVSMRRADRFSYAMSLREIDSKRVDGKFVDANGEKVGLLVCRIVLMSVSDIIQAQGQYALLFLLRRCHGLLYRLMSESEPISEELMPIVRSEASHMIAQKENLKADLRRRLTSSRQSRNA